MSCLGNAHPESGANATLSSEPCERIPHCEGKAMWGRGLIAVAIGRLAISAVAIALPSAPTFCAEVGSEARKIFS